MRHPLVRVLGLREVELAERLDEAREDERLQEVLLRHERGERRGREDVRALARRVSHSRARVDGVAEGVLAVARAEAGGVRLAREDGIGRADAIQPRADAVHLAQDRGDDGAGGEVLGRGAERGRALEVGVKIARASGRQARLHATHDVKAVRLGRGEDRIREARANAVGLHHAQRLLHRDRAGPGQGRRRPRTRRPRTERRRARRDVRRGGGTEAPTKTPPSSRVSSQNFNGRGFDEPIPARRDNASTRVTTTIDFVRRGTTPRGAGGIHGRRARERTRPRAHVHRRGRARGRHRRSPPGPAPRPPRARSTRRRALASSALVAAWVTRLGAGTAAGASAAVDVTPDDAAVDVAAVLAEARRMYAGGRLGDADAFLDAAATRMMMARPDPAAPAVVAEPPSSPFPPAAAPLLKLLGDVRVDALNAPAALRAYTAALAADPAGASAPGAFFGRANARESPPPTRSLGRAPPPTPPTPPPSTTTAAASPSPRTPRTRCSRSSSARRRSARCAGGRTRGEITIARRRRF